MRRRNTRAADQEKDPLLEDQDGVHHLQQMLRAHSADQMQVRPPCAADFEDSLCEACLQHGLCMHQTQGASTMQPELAACAYPKVLPAAWDQTELSQLLRCSCLLTWLPCREGPRLQAGKWGCWART